MRKLLGIVLTSILLSCQSNNIIVKPYQEVNIKSKENIIDLGNKGPSVKINLNFNKSNPFIIKNIDDSFNGITSVSRIEIRLSTSQGSSLSDRFGLNCPCPPTTRNGVAYIDIINPSISNSITVKGLKPNTNYYISARAYANLKVGGTNQEVNVTSLYGNPSNLGGGTAGAFRNTNEEYISVDSNGILTINNDDDPLNSGIPNQDWDISLQLMKSKGASISDNRINIQNGNNTTNSSVNLVYNSYTNNKIVNRFIDGNQQKSSVAIANNGNYMVVWDGEGTGDTSGIFARLYDKYGNTLINEILVNETTDNDQRNPKIATDGTNFVVVWEGLGGGGDNDIFGKKFNNDGTVSVNEFIINSASGNQIKPSISKNSSGNMIVVWESDESADNNIKGQYFNSSGPVGSEFLVNDYTIGDQLNPSVVIDNSGRFIVVWEGEGSDDTDHGIYIRKFDNTQTPLTNDIRVNENISSQQKDSSISMNRNTGEFAVSFVSHSNKVHLQKYLPDMKKKGNEIIFSNLYNAYQTNLSLSNNGIGILTWLESNAINGIIHLRMLDIFDINNSIINGFSFDYNNDLSYPFVNLNGKQGIFTWTDSQSSDPNIYKRELIIP